MKDNRKLALAFLENALTVKFEDEYKNQVSVVTEGSVLENKFGYFLVLEKVNANLFKVCPLIEYPSLASKDDIIVMPTSDLYPISPLWFANVKNTLTLPLGILKRSVNRGILPKPSFERVINNDSKFTGQLNNNDEIYKKFQEILDKSLKPLKDIENLLLSKISDEKVLKVASTSEILEFNNALVIISPEKLKVLVDDENAKFVEVYVLDILFDVLEIKDKQAEISLKGVNLDLLKDNLKIKIIK